jgi:cobalt-zinc-cadmium efflux system outer membrane protein
MHRSSRSRACAWALAAWAAIGPGVAPALPPSDDSLGLVRAFEAAWQRQPEVASQAARRQAAEGAARAASRWVADAPALDVAARSDRLNSNDGSREYDLALALPLWLPDERARSGALAAAEDAALAAKWHAARLRVAASVRDAWWAAQLARLDETLAQTRLDSARQLASDTARRVRAGDLARADQFQADSALAQAEGALAEAAAAAEAATLALRTLTGTTADATADIASDTAADTAVSSAVTTPSGAPAAPSGAEPLPPPAARPTDLDVDHPTLAELAARAALGARAAELAATQTRANPELLLGAKSERGQRGEPYDHSLIIGVRVPFGGGGRADAKIAAARADALEAQAQLALERTRLHAEIEAARLRVSASRTRLAAADKQWRLADELRGFIDKSFKLGETDLPTRLRVELDAVTAQRQAARLRIEAAAAVSALRQALGLLPQ